MSGFRTDKLLGENLSSAAKAGAGVEVIAGLKRCTAQKLEQPRAESDCRSLPLVGMTKFILIGRSVNRALLRSWRECGAAEIAEAAFVLPLLFMFVLGILQFGRMYLVYSTIQRAAMEGARAAAGSTCATCGVVPLTGALVATNVVGPILQNAHVDQTLLTAPAVPARLACQGLPVGCDGSGTGATPKICMQRNVVLNLSTGGVATSGTPVCGTSVRLVYPYNFSLPSVSTAPPYVTRQNYALNLKAQAQVKEED